MTAPENLTPQQLTAIAALLTEPSRADVAAKAKTSEATLYRWLREEAFQAAYRQAQRDAFGHTMARLQTVASEAVDTLHSVMSDPDAKASARVAAARTVLEFARQHLDTTDLVERMEAIEAELARRSSAER